MSKRAEKAYNAITQLKRVAWRPRPDKIAKDMHQFTIMRNSKPYSFDGKLLASVQGNPVHSEDGEYQLLVYRASTGTFVSVIEFVSPTAAERVLSLADEMDTLNDVEDFFFSFEPAELLPETLASLPGEERAALLGRLYLEFEQQVGILLRNLNSGVTNESASSRVHR